MTQMSMNKAIHGAIRRDIQRFQSALGSFPDGNQVRAAALARAWDNLDYQVTSHHEGEHEIAWPALKLVGVNDEVLTQMNAEHDELAAALNGARTAMETLARSASATDAAAAGSAFDALHGVAVRHFQHEEAQFEPIFIDQADSPEIQAMGKDFGKVSPARGGTFFAWVLDGASDDEVAAIKHSVPGPVLKLIGGIFGRGYRKNIAPVWST